MNRTVRETLAFAGEKVIDHDHREKRAAARESRRRLAQRRREFQQDALARGVHPATGSPLLENSTARCRDCVHAIAARYAKTYWKCENASLSHSEATDIRVSWPACTQFEPRPA